MTGPSVPASLGLSSAAPPLEPSALSQPAHQPHSQFLPRLLGGAQAPTQLPHSSSTMGVFGAQPAQLTSLLQSLSAVHTGLSGGAPSGGATQVPEAAAAGGGATASAGGPSSAHQQQGMGRAARASSEPRPATSYNARHQQVGGHPGAGAVEGHGHVAGSRGRSSQELICNVCATPHALPCTPPPPPPSPLCPDCPPTPPRIFSTTAG